MKKGDYVYTPRFCNVQIKKVFRSFENAHKAGYNEPTFYKDDKYGVLGKNIYSYNMEFAGFLK